MQKYLGLRFDEGNQNCFTLMRQYMADTYGIDDIPNYACPTEWFMVKGFDFFSKLAKTNSFELVEGEWRDGDVLLMSIMSPHGVANHCAVIVNNGQQILHHAEGRFSELSDIRGFWRRATIAVYRHKKIPEVPVKTFSLEEIKNVLGPF